MKLIHHIPLFVIAACMSVFAGVAHAQESVPSHELKAPSNEGYVDVNNESINLQQEKTVFAPNETIFGDVAVFNRGDVDVSNAILKYSFVSIDEVSGGTRELLSTSQSEEIFLGANTEKIVPFEVVVPAFSVSNKFQIKFSVVTKGGNSLTFFTYDVATEGLQPGLEVKNVTVQVRDKTYEAQDGPTVYEGETVQATVSLTNSSEGRISAAPYVVVSKMDDTAETLQEGPAGDLFTLDPGMTQDVVISLPTMNYVPGVYVAELELKNGDGALVASKMLVRYIIGGGIVTIRSISTDKDEVVANDIVTVKINYTGTTFDIDNGAKAQIGNGSFLVSLTNEEGLVIGEGQAEADFNADVNTIEIPITVTAAAQQISAKVVAAKDGKTYGEYSGLLTEKLPEPVESPLLKTILSIIAALVLVAAVAWAFLRNRNKNKLSASQNTLNSIAIVLCLFGATFFVSSHNVEAASKRVSNGDVSATLFVNKTTFDAGTTQDLIVNGVEVNAWTCNNAQKRVTVTYQFRGETDNTTYGTGGGNDHNFNTWTASLLEPTRFDIPNINVTKTYILRANITFSETWTSGATDVTTIVIDMPIRVNGPSGNAKCGTAPGTCVGNDSNNQPVKERQYLCSDSVYRTSCTRYKCVKGNFPTCGGTTRGAYQTREIYVRGNSTHYYSNQVHNWICYDYDGRANSQQLPANQSCQRTEYTASCNNNYLYNCVNGTAYAGSNNANGYTYWNCQSEYGNANAYNCNVQRAVCNNTVAGTCTVGSATAVTTSGGNQTWTCSNKGTTAACTKAVAASCGTANGNNVSATPTGTAACTSGSATSMTTIDTGWTWSCGVAQCAANKICSSDSQCGSGICDTTSGSCKNDMCKNIPGDQNTVPAGYTRDSNSNCTEVVVDICSNISGTQASLPAGTYKSGSNCLCSNNGTNPPTCTAQGGQILIDAVVAPSVVDEGEQCPLSWSATGGAAAISCTVDGAGSYSGEGSANLNIGDHSVTCTDGVASATTQVSCKLNPNFQEF